jgi:cysteine desulfurase / selenocysteine lyase
MFPNIRDDFPMLHKKMHGHPLIYFDTAATAQKPQVVIDSISDFYSNHYGTVHRAVYELAVHSSQAYQDVRQRLQRFLNASKAEEIIFTRGATESINLVAYSFGKAFIQPGDEILISEMEHHSNIVPWQILCEDRGAILKVIPINNSGELLMDEYQKLLTSKTKLVAVTHISNALGTVNPIKLMAEMAHEAGAKILIDGSQSAPHIPIDVQKLEIDFFVFSGHKCYGPTGIGVLYAKSDLMEQMPPYQGGGDMIEEVTFEKTTYNTLPLKFEAGTPMIAEVIGLGAAINYLSQLDLSTIHNYEQQLLEYATKKMRAIPKLTILGTAKEKGALISFTVDGVHPLDMATLLDLNGIAIRSGHHCAQPALRRLGALSTGTARASFSFYNTFDEIDRFIEVLNKIIPSLSHAS